MTKEEADIETAAYLERVAKELGWTPDTALTPVSYLAQVGLKLTTLLESFTLLARAARHLSLATPDKVLRSELVRAVEQCSAVLAQFGAVPTTSAPLARHALKLQLGVEQALYRTAFREEQAKDELKKTKARLDKALEIFADISAVGLKDSIAAKVDAFLAEHIPDCDCGYSRSDSMIDHHESCAWLQFGRKHNLKRVAYDVRST